MGIFKDTAAGMALTLVIATISFLTSSLHPSFDSLVISIIFGMLVSNILGDREVLEKGVNSALKLFLPIGIGLYGMQLSFGGAGKTWPAVPAVIAVLALTFSVTYFIAKGFGLGKGLSVLLGAGLSICGASAIAVIAPLIDSKKEDTSISIISLITVGLTGMLIYSFMPEVFGLSKEGFAFLTGTTLPMFGQVNVASAAMGPESAAMAMNFKLIRVSSLAVFAGAAIVASAGRTKKLYIPWFMVMFFALAAASNLSERIASLRGVVNPAATFLLSASLAAIGLSVDFDSITEKGATPLFSLFLSWGITVMTVYLFLSVIG